MHHSGHRKWGVVGHECLNCKEYFRLGKKAAQTLNMPKAYLRGLQSGIRKRLDTDRN